MVIEESGVSLSGSNGFTFSKKERLCSRTLIDKLFHQGHRIMSFPFSISWMAIPMSEDAPFEAQAQVLINTSKRKFHHAVDRNRVKRLTRECYRLRKPQLYAFLAEKQLQLVFSINYIHNEIWSYQQLQHKLDKALDTLVKDISKSIDTQA